MNFVLAVLVVIVFAAILERARLITHVRDVVRRARANYSVVADPALTDEQKERRLRAETPQLFALLGRIVLWSVLALALPLAALWIGDRLAVLSLAAVLAVFMRLDFLLVLTAAGILVWWLSSRYR
jgi:hypothetical protein